MRDTIDMAREAGFPMAWISENDGGVIRWKDIKAFEALVRADERMSFYGQDKPAECADGCPPNQICDYCQLVAPVKAMIFAEREACAKVCEERAAGYEERAAQPKDVRDINPEVARIAVLACGHLAAAIRNRGNT